MGLLHIAGAACRKVLKRSFNTVSQTGISSIEWQGYAAEKYAGIPDMPSHVSHREENDDAERKEAEKHREMAYFCINEKFEDLRKMYNDAGVKSTF